MKAARWRAGRGPESGAGQTIGNDGTQSQRLGDFLDSQQSLMLVRLQWQTIGNGGTAKPEAKAAHDRLRK